MLDLNNLTPEQLQELQAQLAAALSTTTPPPPVQYRVYYDSEGKITTYTTEDTPGQYIVITKEQYQQARHDAVVKDGRLVYTHIKNDVVKLVRDRNNATGFRVSKYDASVVADNDDLDIHYYTTKVYDITR